MFDSYNILVSHNVQAFFRIGAVKHLGGTQPKNNKILSNESLPVLLSR